MRNIRRCRIHKLLYLCAEKMIRASKLCGASKGIVAFAQTSEHCSFKLRQRLLVVVDLPLLPPCPLCRLSVAGTQALKAFLVHPPIRRTTGEYLYVCV